jgi:hypothetical protein
LNELEGKMKLNFRITPAISAALLATAFAVSAQEHKGQHSNEATKSPEIFCSHMKTGQLCPGNASMFQLTEAQKQRYREALMNYNKAVDTAQKQFLAGLKDKVHLSDAELALAESWFAQGLNPEINKILAARQKVQGDSNNH